MTPVPPAAASAAALPLCAEEPGRAPGPAVEPPAPSWILGLLQTSDSFFPTGSYAHSFGLEGLVQSGVIRDAATLREFLRLSVIPSLRQAELPLAAHAWTALGGPDWAAVARLCELAAALRAPRELRAASDKIGRQRVELAVRLHGHPLAQEYQRRAAAEGWPHAAAVAAALEGRVLGAPCAAVLAGVCYSALAGCVSAAMKLLRIGQNTAQALLAEALAGAPGAIAAAAAVPAGQIGWFNPWLDIASARHETADARMFIS